MNVNYDILLKVKSLLKINRHIYHVTNHSIVVSVLSYCHQFCAVYSQTNSVDNKSTVVQGKQ